MLIHGELIGEYEVILPALKRIVQLNKPMGHAEQVCDLIKAEIQQKFGVVVITTVASIQRSDFTIDLPLCRESIAWLISEIRVNSGESQLSLGKKLDKANTNFSRYESGERMPNLEAFEELLKACGLQINLSVVSNREG